MLDVVIVAAFIVYSITSGFRNKKAASKNLNEYFLAGRTLSGWKAGFSMAATQYAADTPLLVTGLIATAGVFALWRLWIYALAFLLMGFLLSGCWRRARVLTDAEFTRVRYSGRGITAVRSVKAVYYGTIINCTVLAMVFLAAMRIAEVLCLWHLWLPGEIYAPLVKIVSATGLNLASPQSILDPVYATTNNVITIVLIAVFTTLYSTSGGLRSVAATDVVQFVIAMAATLIYAVIAVREAGGLHMLSNLASHFGEDSLRRMLSFTPRLSGDELVPFLAVIALQWFFQMNSDGTGYLAQRSMACRSDKDARLAAIVFTVAQVLFRSIIWLPIGIALLLIFEIDSQQKQTFMDRNLEQAARNGTLSALADSENAGFLFFTHKASQQTQSPALFFKDEETKKHFEALDHIYALKGEETKQFFLKSKNAHPVGGTPESADEGRSPTAREYATSSGAHFTVLYENIPPPTDTPARAREFFYIIPQSRLIDNAAGGAVFECVIGTGKNKYMVYSRTRHTDADNAFSRRQKVFYIMQAANGSITPGLTDQKSAFLKQHETGLVSGTEARKAYQNARVAFGARREITFGEGAKKCLQDYAGLLGLMIVGIFAALASTLDTHMNWGGGYWSNDIYKELISRTWLQREPSARELVWVARASNILIILIAFFIMTRLKSIHHAWQISLLVGAGMGAVLVLRWLWERINLFSEITAMVVSIVVAPVLLFTIEADWIRLVLMAAVSTSAVVGVTLLTPPTDQETLKAFFMQVRPVGFWKKTAAAAGLDPKQPVAELRTGIVKILLVAAIVFSGLIGCGTLLFSLSHTERLWCGVWFGLLILCWYMYRTLPIEKDTYRNRF